MIGLREQQKDKKKCIFGSMYKCRTDSSFCPVEKTYNDKAIIFHPLLGPLVVTPYLPDGTEMVVIDHVGRLYDRV